jgi:hypothetical protein
MVSITEKGFMKKMLTGVVGNQLIRRISSSMLLSLSSLIIAFAFWTTSPLNAKDKEPSSSATPDSGGPSDSDKCTICHVPPGNPANAHTITVGCSAVEAHLRNHPGDCLGPCPCQPTPKQNP